MKLFREIANGFLWAVGSVLLVSGAFSLTIVEGIVQAPTSTPEEQIVGHIIPSEIPIMETEKITSPTTIPAVWTITKPEVQACVPPTDWIAYTIGSADTLTGLASEFGISVEEIQIGNCLVQDKLIVGTTIFLPTIPTTTLELTETPYSLNCSIPTGWISYTVKHGDNLFSISMSHEIAVWQLKTGNCLGQSDIILVGQILFVPNVWVPSDTLTATSTKVKTTRTFTVIPTRETLSTETLTETATESPTETITETLTETPTPPTETIIP